MSELGKGVIAMTRLDARTHLRRVKHGRSWREFSLSVPGVTIATLRRFVTDETYTPRDPIIRSRLGLPPFPPLESDLLAIIHGPVRIDRTQKRVFAKDPNKNRGKK